MATAKTNGAATATTATKKAGVSATRKTTTTKSAQDKTPVIQAVNVDNRIKTIQKLMEWSRQRERLHETRNELSAFSFGSDQLKDKLEITDSSGLPFPSSKCNLLLLSRHIFRSY